MYKVVYTKRKFKSEDKYEIIQSQASVTEHGRWQRRRSEFESAGAVGIEMLKFEAKKGDFAKIWQKLGGGYSPPAPRLRRPWIKCEYKINNGKEVNNMDIKMAIRT